MLSIDYLMDLSTFALYFGIATFAFTTFVLVFGGNSKRYMDFSAMYFSAAILFLAHAYVQYDIENKPAPVSWFETLPHAELDTMLNYVKNTHQTLTVNEFKFIHHNYQQMLKHKVSSSDIKYEKEVEKQLKALQKAAS